MSSHGVSGKVQSDLNGESILLEEPRSYMKELTKIEKMDSINVPPNVVVAATPSKVFPYIRILEPTVDPIINGSLVTYCSFMIISSLLLRSQVYFMLLSLYSKCQLRAWELSLFMQRGVLICFKGKYL